jgi:hypothetical protein
MMDLLQWPGMALGLAGAPLVASTSAGTRRIGFGLWLISNACWIAWGLDAAAWGLVAMQVVFCWSSWRGWRNNRPDHAQGSSHVA